MAKGKQPATPDQTLEPNQSPTAPAAAGELVKARVLATCVFGTADDVVELPAEAVTQGVAAGQLDPHPDAVAYAASLK